jgi:hypothetical protein
MQLTNSGGAITQNIILFPNVIPGGASNGFGIALNGANAAFSVTGNVETGGCGDYTHHFVQLSNITTGPLTLAGNTFTGTNCGLQNYGLWAQAVTSQVG